jgi:aminopeptidase
MTDIRMERLADILVNYSTRVGTGDWVGLLGNADSLPILRVINRKVIEAGGNPTLLITDEVMARDLLRSGSDEQLQWVDPGQSVYHKNADVYIRVHAPSNTRANTHIDASRNQMFQKAHSPWLDIRLQRQVAGKMRWVVAMLPTEALAQEAGMSLEEYEAFVYSATFADREDPVAEWQKLSVMQQQKVDWLKGRKQVHVQGPNADLQLSIEGRVFLNACGERNMPDGEIFTGPVEDSVNGWIRFSYPSIVAGRAVEGIELKFEQGKVVQASAQTNEDLLFSMLDTDPGARYLGEFAIGTNFGIDRFTGSILYDEKIGGTIHLAVGRTATETGGVNQSAIHWDMICDMRTDSTITVDGDLFYKDGAFTV